MTDLSILAALALGTFISEDLTSISAGLLARNGEVRLASAVTACALGIYIGDLALWCAGRILGRRLLALPSISRRIDASALGAVGARIETNLGMAVLASRFLPGTRLPLYVAAGIWGRRPVAFAAWSLLAVLLWTPLLVVSAARYGSAVTAPLLGQLGDVSRLVLTAALLFGGLKLAAQALRRVTV